MPPEGLSRKAAGLQEDSYLRNFLCHMSAIARCGRGVNVGGAHLHVADHLCELRVSHRFHCRHVCYDVPS
jgi:hypothetical protein